MAARPLPLGAEWRTGAFVSSIRHGIRYRLSVVLLLSALNSVALFALAIVLFSAVAESPPRPLLEAVLRMQEQADAAQDIALTGDLTDEAVRAAVLDRADRAGGALRPVQGLTPSLAADLAAWQLAVRRLVEEGGVGPDLSWQPGSTELEEVLRTHRHLRGSAQLAIAAPRPVWVEQLLPWIPWGVAWVLLVGGLTLVAAWSLHGLLYRPLIGLAEAARAVARGDLGAAIPEPTGAPEISALALAMSQARDNLVASLHETEARSAREKALLAYMTDGVLLVGSDGRVLQINPRGESLLWTVVPAGVEPRLGERIERLIPELAPERLRAREPSELEVRREASPGQPLVVLRVGLRPVPALERGAAGSTVLMLRDVSAERELERMQGEFLSVVTHELKTPLTAIDGYARLLARGKAGELNERQRSFVETILAQTEVLREMVQNLLDASRLETGRLPIETRPVEVGALLEEIVRTWKGGADARGIELLWEDEGLRGDRVRVDPFRMQQVLGNLVGNALKFTAAGGRIVLTGARDGDQIRVEVRDTGRGIAPDKLERIFDKFFQVERTDTRNAGGAGLGLYICKQLVEAMGGRIGAISRPGEGSRFIIHLPVDGGESDERTQAG